jgi:hypothetical protein
MPKEAQVETEETLEIATPFFGGDPIEEEDLGTLNEEGELVTSILPPENNEEETPVEETPAVEESPEAEPSTPDETETEGDETEEATPGEDEEGDSPAEETPAGEPETENPPNEETPQLNIPKHRLDREINKRKRIERELLQQIEDLKAAQGSPDTSTPEGAEVEANFEAVLEGAFEKVLDGDVATAVKEITGALQQRDQAVRSSAVKESREMTTQERIQEELDTATDSIVETFPELDASSENAQGELIEEVVILRDAYIQSGKYSPGVALELAAEAVMRREHPDRFAEKVEPPKEISAAPTKRPGPANVTAKVKAANAQPPQPENIPRETPEETEVNVMNLSEEDFEKLSDIELRKLRGDII